MHAFEVHTRSVSVIVQAYMEVESDVKLCKSHWWPVDYDELPSTSDTDPDPKLA